MSKIIIEFDTIEQANAAWTAAYGAAVIQPVVHAAPQPVHVPAAAPPAPAQVYAPAAPAPAAQPPQPTFTQPAPAPAPGGGITQPMIVAACQAYSKAKTPAGTKAVLAEFGAKGVGDVQPANYPALLARLQQL